MSMSIHLDGQLLNCPDSFFHLCPLRRPDQWQRTFHLCSSRSRGQIPQCRQLRLLPLLSKQPAVPVVTATLWHVRRDAIWPQPSAGGLQEQPVPQPAAQRHRWPHYGVQPGPARQQVHTGSITPKEHGSKTHCSLQKSKIITALT